MQLVDCCSRSRWWKPLSPLIQHLLKIYCEHSLEEGTCMYLFAQYIHNRYAIYGLCNFGIDVYWYTEIFPFCGLWRRSMRSHKGHGSYKKSRWAMSYMMLLLAL
jgi:hypothetical protein